MTTETKSFERANNQSWFAEFVLTNSEVSPPEPHQLTISTVIRLQVRDQLNPQELKLDFRTGVHAELTIQHAESAKIRINVPAKTMRTIAPGVYPYDIIVAQASGRVYRPVAGTLTVILGITELPA